MSSTDFTEREQKMMALAWQCFDADPKIDFKKLAALNGMSNPRSASNAWSAIKKKITAKAAEAGAGVTDGAATTGGEGDETASPTKATAKATPKRKKKDAGAADAVDDESPTKKAKTPKGKGKGKEKKSEVNRERSPIKGEPNDDED